MSQNYTAHPQDQLHPHAKFELNLTSRFWDTVWNRKCDADRRRQHTTTTPQNFMTNRSIYATQHKCWWHKKDMFTCKKKKRLLMIYSHTQCRKTWRERSSMLIFARNYEITLNFSCRIEEKKYCNICTTHFQCCFYHQFTFICIVVITQIINTWHLDFHTFTL